MYKDSKSEITCPICGHVAVACFGDYCCSYCEWESSQKTLDILYDDPISSPLSNLFPHRFIFYFDTSITSIAHCMSMESFLQSLKIKNAETQKFICENYTGITAKKLSPILCNWKEKQVLYWNSIPFKRDSKEYAELITKAYDALYETNLAFRTVVLPRYRKFTLIHSIGSEDIHDTVLTSKEYLFQLNRLLNKK